MPLAVLVEGSEANPTILLDPVTLKDEDVPAQLDAAMDAYNAGNVLSKATGALLWYDDRPNQTFEYFVKERAVRARQFPAVVSLTGFYTCASGRRYWYYGKVVGWVKGKRTYWEARLFHHDKKFVFDGVFDSKDLLAILSHDFYAIDSHARRLKPIAEMELFTEIEDWDSKREPG